MHSPYIPQWTSGILIASEGTDTTMPASMEFSMTWPQPRAAIFVHFNNDLAGAMREISEPPESYSIFAFAPVNLPVDGKYHSLKLSLVGKSEFMNSVQAQRGFFAPNHTETSAGAAKRTIA
jgi:hypothetical protein